jgi:seryl-tRNA synthetase
MLDLKLIRSEPERVRAALARRGAETGALDALLAADEEWRRLVAEQEGLNHRRNVASEEISRIKRAGGDASEPIAATRAVSDQIQALNGQVREVEARINDLLLTIPNLPHASVPPGKDDSENPEVGRWGEPRRFDFDPKPHWDVGEALGIVDFERGVKLAGARFYVLRGAGARLERALINWMLDFHAREHGQTEIWAGVLVNRASMTGTGQLPKFEFDMYRIEGEELFLSPTAEVPVTNLHRDEILAAEQLPLEYVSYSPCFRKEAGAAGRDTRGMIRVHQFDKVEIVKIVRPETSYAELESLRRQAESVLEALRLPYRTVEICTGDLSDKQAKAYDPEVWMPGSNRWAEISSCSNFEAYQARRANIRFRPEKGAKPEFVHTLNGSGLAVGRTFAAILENYQEADGSVTLPEVLRPYMGGHERIAAGSS